MANTRDHVAAHDYESRRRVTSLMVGADEARGGSRRWLNRTLVGSVVLAVPVLPGAGVAGWLGAGRSPDLPDSAWPGASLTVWGEYSTGSGLVTVPLRRSRRHGANQIRPGCGRDVVSHR